MFKWIQENRWLPNVYLGLSCFLVLGGLDLVIFGLPQLPVCAFFAVAIIFARRLPWASLLMILAGDIAQVILELTPSFAGLSVIVALLVISAFGSKAVRVSGLLVSLIGATMVVWFLTFGDQGSFLALGITVGETQKPLVFGASMLLTSGWLALAWLLGRLAFVQLEHVGSPLDRALTLLTQARLNFELARQNERLDIVKDLSELLIQRVGAVLSLTEGGSYAVRQNPDVAERVLERATEAAKAAQLELRRLFDLLHAGSLGAAVTPRLADLDALLIAYRELGYNTEMRFDGESFALDEGAEMCLYKIVFESLENVRKHAPRGTNVTIEFTWVTPGLQLMIKDNGFETANRERDQLGELVEGYGLAEDLSALVQQIEGSTISTMRERAALYEGSVEASSQPGVGFTIAAIFPNLKTVVEGK